MADPTLRAEPSLEVPMSDHERLVVSVPEAARLLDISRTHAYELIARGELPSIRLGRRILVPLRPLLRLLEGAGASLG
jgi:excisionase family DNA binding protein